jgi:hypothetical protein
VQPISAYTNENNPTSQCLDNNIYEQGNIITHEYCASLGIGTTNVKLAGTAVVLSLMVNAQIAGVMNKALILMV